MRLTTALLAQKSQKRIPGFRILDGIRSAGTQYINTGVIPTVDTKIEVDITVLKNPGDPFECLFGTQNNMSFSRFYMLIGSASNTLQAMTGNSPNGDSSQLGIVDYKFAYKSRHNFWLRYGQFGVDDQKWTMKSSKFTCSYPLVLFSRASEGKPGNNAKMTLHNCKIHSGDVLIRDFIPAERDSDGEVGLYDMVNKKFYTNAGTGIFEEAA